MHSWWLVSSVKSSPGRGSLRTWPPPMKWWPDMGVKIDDDLKGGSDDKRPAMSASSQLVELAQERYRFRVSEERQPYAVKPGRHVVRLLRGGKNSLRAELSQAFYHKHRKVPPQQALADAMLVLEGMA